MSLLFISRVCKQLHGVSELCLFVLLSPKTDDDLAQPFDVYVQILISQALEPGFLSALRDQQGNAQILHKMYIYLYNFWKMTNWPFYLITFKFIL